MEGALLTIIVPVYNTVEYLERCVHSITAQTYKNLEILLIDDGSTDGSGELCDKLAKEDERIRVFHKENGGVSSARNVGLKEAKGEYYGFVDSDDYIEPEMYERLYAIIKKLGIMMAQVGRDEIDEEGNPLPDVCELVEYELGITRKELFRDLLMHKGDASFCTKLTARSMFDDLEFPDGKLNEDFRVLTEMLVDITFKGVAVIPYLGYHVFYRANSNSRRSDKNDFSQVYGDSVDHADVALDATEDCCWDLIDVAFRFCVCQRLQYLLHIPIPQMNKQKEQYCAIVKWMRQNWWRSMRNTYLTKKEKLYHTLFAIAPKGIRQIHAFIRRK
ncbi:MAG: glycosyltransferase family 2 protein [Lachnospiraceae bacterium]|nr:glycosyltransferase family 2 protein [Lachnospiraceae bacterium]